MAITLDEPIDATQERVVLTEPLEAQPGDLFRIGDEAVVFGAYGRIAPEMRLPDHSRKVVIFQRGAVNTTAVPHLAGVAVLRAVDGLISNVTEPAPWAGGAGGVTSVNGSSGVVVLDAADVGAQPLDSDLTAIAALPTTSFGRDFLVVPDIDALVAMLQPYFLEPD